MFDITSFRPVIDAIEPHLSFLTDDKHSSVRDYIKIGQTPFLVIKEYSKCYLLNGDCRKVYTIILPNPSCQKWIPGISAEYEDIFSIVLWKKIPLDELSEESQKLLTHLRTWFQNDVITFNVSTAGPENNGVIYLLWITMDINKERRIQLIFRPCYPDETSMLMDNDDLYV